MGFPDLTKYDYFALDTETTGLVYPRDRAIGVSVATPDGRSWYWDLREDWLAKDALIRMLKDCKRIICHNAVFDYKMLLAAGIHSNPESYDDTGIRACLLDEHLPSYSLDHLASTYLGAKKESDIYGALAQLYGGRATRKAQMGNLHRAPSDVVEKYAKVDAELTLALWEHQNDMARDQDSIDELCPPIKEIWEFERSLMPYIFDMTTRGIRVDTDAAHAAAERLEVHIHSATIELNKMAGRQINVNSSPQMRELFRPEKDEQGVWSTGGVRLESTKMGAPSLDAIALRALADAGDKRAELVQRIRSMIKTKDTFLLGHVVGHEVDGRVYPSINQSKGESGGTGTGRLSYTDPALQQIPSRDKVTASIVKPVFLPDEGEMWLDADENSFEVRVFAHLVGKFDHRIVKRYKEDPRTDFHQYVSDLTGLVRNATYSGQPNAKQLNLSMIFNAGNGSTAEQMGLDWEWAEFENEEGGIIRYKMAGPEAREIINEYHHQLPGVKKLQNKAREVAIVRGFVYTARGRRIRFPKGWKVYKASGLLIQATAADYNKENIAIISEYCKKNGGRLVLNTHDSYSMSVSPYINEAREWWRGLQSELEAPDRARVPLLMDVSGAGITWWDALNDRADFNGAKP